METSEQTSIEAQYAQAEKELRRSQNKLVQLRKQLAKPITQDYIFTGPENTLIKFSSLFGAQQDLIVIHNMGVTCVYCTLWADEFNGVLSHLLDRAGTFREDMGFQSAEQLLPGISPFHKNTDGLITSVASDFFGAGDNYSGIWHIFDLLLHGSNGWEPQYRY
jgi:Bacterial protein of unknown function (DUF899)